MDSPQDVTCLFIRECESWLAMTADPGYSNHLNREPQKK